MKERKFAVTPTPEQIALAFGPEQIGEALYAKLKDDPNYALVSTFCRNSGKRLAEKVEYYEQMDEMPRQVLLSYDNAMWSWENIELIALSVDPGHRDHRHRILYVRVPFPDNDRVMSVPMLSASLDKILAFLRSPEFGPKQMMVLDDLDIALGKHD